MARKAAASVVSAEAVVLDASVTSVRVLEAVVLDASVASSARVLLVP